MKSLPTASRHTQDAVGLGGGASGGSHRPCVTAGRLDGTAGGRVTHEAPPRVLRVSAEITPLRGQSDRQALRPDQPGSGPASHLRRRCRRVLPKCTGASRAAAPQVKRLAASCGVVGKGAQRRRSACGAWRPNCLPPPVQLRGRRPIRGGDGSPQRRDLPHGRGRELPFPPNLLPIFPDNRG